MTNSEGTLSYCRKKINIFRGLLSSSAGRSISTVLPLDGILVPYTCPLSPCGNLVNVAQESGPRENHNETKPDWNLDPSMFVWTPWPLHCYELFYQNFHHFVLVLQGLFILVFYLLLDKTVRNSLITQYLLKSNKLACVVGGIRERASERRSRHIPSRSPRGNSRVAKPRKSTPSPILSRLCHSCSRLLYQIKSTRAQNPASYAGYK